LWLLFIHKLMKKSCLKTFRWEIQPCWECSPFTRIFHLPQAGGAKN
jgi:hypothetical protein